MSYQVLQNWRYGMDLRRSVLTSESSVLLSLTDAFINAGGEVEKRKAFVRLGAFVTAGSLTTFGFDALKNKFAIYGGDAPASGVTFRSDTQYYRLWLDNSVYSFIPLVGGAAVKATAVVYSTVFNNQPFVIATMNDPAATTLCFYGGTLVPAASGVPAYYNATPIKDFFMGRALTGMSVANMTAMLKKVIDDYGQGYSATNPFSSTVVITGPKGAEYRPDVTDTSSVWSITPTLTKAGSGFSIDAVAPQASFQITGGPVTPAASDKITSVTVGGTELLTGSPTPTPIPFTSSKEITAGLVVASINTNSTTSGYSAKANGNVVMLYSNLPGTTNNNKEVIITTSGQVAIGQGVIEFGGTGFTLDYIKVNGTNILSSAPVYDSSTETIFQYVERVVTQFTDYPFTGTPATKILGLPYGPQLFLSNRVTSCMDKPSIIDVKVTPTSGQTGYVTIPFGPKLTLRTQPEAGLFLRTNVTNDVLANGPVSALVTGGVPPYTYSWEIILPVNCPLAVTLQDAGKQSTLVNSQVLAMFYDTTQQNTNGRTKDAPSGKAIARVTVMDALGVKLTGDVILNF